MLVAMWQSLVSTIFLVLLVNSAAQRDPFDMFAEPPHPTHEPVSEFMSTAPSNVKSTADQDISTIEHYRELHRVLVRILWNNLKVAEDLKNPSEQGIMLQMSALLDEKDVTLLGRYCSLNQTVSRTVSADTINSIFSRLFRSVTIASDTKQDYDFGWFDQPTILYATIFSLSALFLLFVLLRIGLRRLLWLTIPCLVIVAVILQSLVRKYHERLAEKMSVLSRYDGPPEHCKPRHLQSWSVWLSGLVNLRPSHDECARYYQHIVTEPWIATSLEEALWELVMGPMITFGRVSGKSVGLFYDSVVNYVPFWVAIFLIPLCLFVSVIPFLFFVRYLLVTPRGGSVTKRRPKNKQLKSQSLPSITKG